MDLSIIASDARRELSFVFLVHFQMYCSVSL